MRLIFPCLTGECFRISVVLPGTVYNVEGVVLETKCPSFQPSIEVFGGVEKGQGPVVCLDFERETHQIIAEVLHCCNNG